MTYVESSVICQSVTFNFAAPNISRLNKSMSGNMNYFEQFLVSFIIVNITHFVRLRKVTMNKLSRPTHN